MSALLLPGQPGFSEILAIPPPDPRSEVNYVVRSGGEMLEAVNDDQLREYLEGGEYQERLSEIETDEVEIDDGLSSDILYLPCSVCLSSTSR